MQETTILLLVSREDFLQRVLTSLELLECNRHKTNILCIVDGPPELYVKTRNLVADMKYKERLTVMTNQGKAPRLDIPTRRERIANAHNQARELIAHEHGYVFSVEDDTIVPRLALQRLLAVAADNRAFGMAEGVELGRWGVPYVGGWTVNDIYDVKTITSVDLKPIDAGYEEIDAGGLYCALIRADLYKQHEFHSENGLGPDVNFGIELRQLGFQNYIHWGVHCKHYNKVMGKETIVVPTDGAKTVTLTKESDVKWHTSY
jgi:hypothetical protein